jgi:uncharacterized membrane protein
MFQRLSDLAAEHFGKPAFIIFHLCLWTTWFFIEPYPFLFLTLIVSLESILLSGLILNATNRQGELDRLKAREDFDVDMATLEVSEQILAILKAGEKTPLNNKENE